MLLLYFWVFVSIPKLSKKVWFRRIDALNPRDFRTFDCGSSAANARNNGCDVRKGDNVAVEVVVLNFSFTFSLVTAATKLLLFARSIAEILVVEVMVSHLGFVDGNVVLRSTSPLLECIKVALLLDIVCFVSVLISFVFACVCVVAVLSPLVNIRTVPELVPGTELSKSFLLLVSNFDSSDCLLVSKAFFAP